jgi:predicted O-methyltransferase YrrM
MKIEYFNDKVDFLKYLLDVSQSDIEITVSAFLSHKNYLETIHRNLSHYLETKNIRSNRLTNEQGEILYCTAKVMQAKNCIETGAGTGFSSACILMALEDNKLGKLCSIDYPNYQAPFKKIKRDLLYRGLGGTFSFSNIRHVCGYFFKKDYHIPNGFESGWIIPEELRSRWELYPGLSCAVLPKLVKKIKTINFFLHDSLHTKKNMLFELRTIWPILKEKGIIFVDNVNLNSAFEAFVNEIKPKRAVFFATNFGAILK